jgi:hypothetical protein
LRGFFATLRITALRWAFVSFAHRLAADRRCISLLSITPA